MTTTTASHQSASFSIPSIIAVIAAIGSFMVGAVGGLLLALVAIIFGIVGVTLALSPNRRGGVASTFAMAAGFLGIVAALIKALLWIF